MSQEGLDGWAWVDVLARPADRMLFRTVGRLLVTADGQTAVEFSRELPITITQIPFVISSTLPKLSVTALPAGSESAAGEASTTIKVERPKEPA